MCWTVFVIAPRRQRGKLDDMWVDTRIHWPLTCISIIFNYDVYTSSWNAHVLHMPFGRLVGAAPLALGSRALLAQFDDIFFRQLRLSPPIQTVQSWSHQSELSVPVPSLITRTKVQRFVVAIGGWKSQVCPIPDLRKSGAGTLVTMYSKVRLYIHMV